MTLYRMNAGQTASQIWVPVYRWLVMLHGIAPAGYRSFDGPEWSLPSKLGASDAAAGV